VCGNLDGEDMALAGLGAHKIQKKLKYRDEVFWWLVLS
jgi:hypothetical protein